jgi:filamentous hemagglutinin family protein
MHCNHLFVVYAPAHAKPCWGRSPFRFRTIVVTALLLTMALRGHCGAGIATDGSTGARQTIAGANAGAGIFDVPQALGTVAGNNLFHSFSTFNIDTGQTARFTTSTPTLANVISRVSGGSASQINGVLQLAAAAGSAPAFFFINPAGVVFGAGAAIDVPGAFHVSSADYLRFGNDDRFHASLAQGSALSIAAPQAFGFVGATRAPITARDGATLEMKPAQPISIVAGDIEINNGLISTQGGDIRMVALGQVAQEVGFEGVLPVASGNLAILNGGTISSPATGAVNGGAIAVSADSITIDSRGGNWTGILSQAEGNADNQGITGDAGSIEVSASGAIALVNGGEISSSTNSSGNAGTVKVSAGSISLGSKDSAGGGIVSDANYDPAIAGKTGDAGSVEVTASGALSIVNGSQISSRTFSTGNAGTVKVSVGSIAIDGQGGLWTGIASTAIGTPDNAGKTGHAGSLDITAGGALSIVNGAISSSTSSTGNAGTVKVSANSITMDGLNQGGGIFSDSYEGNDGKYDPAIAGKTGDAGSVEVTASGALSIVNGSQITSSTFSPGKAGSVTVSAGSITIGSKDSVGGGIFSQAVTTPDNQGKTGDAGSVDVSASGAIAIVSGGEIASSTFSSGKAGSVTVSAGSITIGSKDSARGGIFSQANGTADNQGKTGDAGSVDVSAKDTLAIVNGGVITSSTFSSGKAGSVKVSAGSITIGSKDSAGGGIFSQAVGTADNQGKTGDAGSVDVSAIDTLAIVNGGEIASSTISSGKAGTVKVSAGSIAIGSKDSARGGIFSQAVGTADNQGKTGDAGSVDVSAIDTLAIVNGGVIASSTFSSGKAGTVKVSAGSIAIGSKDSDGGGIISQAEGNAANQGKTGDAGSVDVSAKDSLAIVNGGEISSSTFSSGKAGTVKVSAGSITIGSKDSARGGIFSQAIGTADNQGKTGDAGSVDVSAIDTLAIVNGGEIASSTFSSGKAGTVKVSAGSIAIGSKDSAGGGIFSNAVSNADNKAITGDAGSVEVTASGALSIVNGGGISTYTSSSGNAGTVKVSAGSLTINGQGVGSGISSDTYSNTTNQGITGDAGSIDVSASGAVAIENGGVISSSTTSSGNAGSVKVSAGSVTINGQGVGVATIASLALGDVDKQGKTGDAGSIEVSAKENLSLVNGGVISSSTNTSGKAGSVTVHAETLRVDGTPSQISAAAFKNSSGQTGSVSVSASDLIALSNGGQISIENNASVDTTPTSTALTVTAPRITITDSPDAITAQSSGNVAASAIDIHASQTLRLDSGGITTTANQGNGGSIDINKTDDIVKIGLIWLENSQIASSVNGDVNGNGGNIRIDADALILKTGFIQANTKAKLASGGEVNINVMNLLASGGPPFVADAEIQTFRPGIFGINVIQAAAPDGVNGA